MHLSGDTGFRTAIVDIAGGAVEAVEESGRGGTELLNYEEGLSMREVDRVEVIREVLGRQLRQGEASERPGICVRQVERLVRRYREEGARGLRSRRRRRASDAIAPELRREILGVVRERYEDFAPTLAWEMEPTDSPKGGTSHDLL